ncbi:zinc ribbon domain-containing protein [Nonomuraea sp. NPDC005650]|uniref:zinc ribbon domain-containing protein n=1 Tax=Nonomuraea sp. NPDC005650 TaxID=3157045 RepID=UPI0033A3F3F5
MGDGFGGVRAHEAFQTGRRDLRPPAGPCPHLFLEGADGLIQISRAGGDVSDEVHAQAQALLVAPRSAAEGRKSRRTPRPYIFRGLLFCGGCERRMQGSWNNDKAHYRCTFPKEYAQANSVKHPRSVYVREELIVEPLDHWLATVFDPERFPTTIQAMTNSQLASDHRMAAVEAARQAVAECERKPVGYRAVFDAWDRPGGGRRLDRRDRSQAKGRADAPGPGDHQGS